MRPRYPTSNLRQRNLRSNTVTVVAGDPAPPAEQTPADFGTLVGWIDPRYNLTTETFATTLTDLQSVMILAQSTQANQPKVIASDSDFNGEPSLVFNGSSTWMNTGFASSWKFLHDGSGATVVVWFYSGASTGTTHVLFDTNSNTTSTAGMSCSWDAVDQKLTVLITNDSGAVSTRTTSNGSCPRGQLNCVIVTNVAGSPNETNIYVNNVAVDEHTHSETFSSSNPATGLYVGADAPTTSSFFNGKIAEISAFTSVLDSSAIEAVYEYGRNRYEGAPLGDESVMESAARRFRAGTATTVDRVSAWATNDSNAHTATVISAPTYEVTGWNGNPSVVFDGSANAVAFDSIAPVFAGSDKPFYMVAAVQMVSSAASQTLWNFGNSTVGAFSVRLDLSTSTLARYVFVKRAGPPAGAQVIIADSQNSINLFPQVLSFIHDGTNLWFYNNEVLSDLVDGDSFDTDSASFDLFTLGCGRGTSSSQFANVRFGAILIYSELTDDGRKQAEQWLIDQGYGYPAELISELYLDDVSWNVPVTGAATVELWGAGGGGTTDTGGGGGGAYARSRVEVDVGEAFDIVIGESADNTDGGDTTFDTNVVVAKGGLSGTNGGTGGTAAASTGDTKFSGGNGSVGTGNQIGGGGAGDIANGNGAFSGANTGGNSATAGIGRMFGGGGGSSAVLGQPGANGAAKITMYDYPDAGYAHITGASRGRVSTGTTHPITMPSNIVPGELLLLIFASANETTIDISDGGWTKLLQQDDDNSSAHSMAIFYKIAEGSDTATATIGSTMSSCHHVFRIANAGTPTGSSMSTNGAIANLEPPTHDTGVSAKYLWLVYGQFDLAGHAHVTSFPADYTCIDFVTQPEQIFICARKAEAASETPGAFTNITARALAATLAIPFSS